jgi:hypothetical protein
MGNIFDFITGERWGYGPLVCGMEMGSGGHAEERTFYLLEIEYSASWNRRIYSFHTSFVSVCAGVYKKSESLPEICLGAHPRHGARGSTCGQSQQKRLPQAQHILAPKRSASQQTHGGLDPDQKSEVCTYLDSKPRTWTPNG